MVIISNYIRERVRRRKGTYIFSLDWLWHWVKASVSPLSTNWIAWQCPGIKTWPTWRMSKVRPPIRFQIVLHEALWLAGDAGKRGGAWWATDQSLLLSSEKKWTNCQNRQFNLQLFFSIQFALNCEAIESLPESFNSMSEVYSCHGTFISW